MILEIVKILFYVFWKGQKILKLILFIFKYFYFLIYYEYYMEEYYENWYWEN